MDDLDHSMHISEYDWTSFYDDSEECGLLQPSLASPDSSSLSDSEDQGNSSSVFSTDQQGPQQSSAANSGEAAGCWDMEEENYTGCVKYISGQIMQSGSGGGQYDFTLKAEICLDHPEGTTINTADPFVEETNDNITATLHTERLNVHSSDEQSTELKKEHGDVQMASDSYDPLSCRRAELNVNELRTADGALSEDLSGIALRAEKERWFVTVNDSPAQQRVRAVKKKRRQKKTPKDNHMCSFGQERSLENSLQLEIIEYNNESEGGTDTEDVTQANQNMVEISGGYPSAEEDPESVQTGVLSNPLQMSLTSVKDNLSGKLVLSHSLKDNIPEPTIERNKHDPSSSASKPLDAFTPKDPSRLDSVESDELEFFSMHSFDSESFLSATESVEELQHLLVEHQQSSLSLTENSSQNSLFSLTDNIDVDNTQDREMLSFDSALSCNVTAPISEGHESTDTEPALAFPSADHFGQTMPDHNSTCDNDTLSTLPSDTPKLRKHEINLSASGGTSGHQLLPIPDLTVTPCSVADSPETYAEAAGHTRPVYAISAFWDEMEKLTINDILQLRMGRSTPSCETRETVTSIVNDHSSSVEYNSSDGGLMDTYDTADSDYFTQPDDSKPDRSSCEFSTSDFEEEYCQFLGVSRNTSPDPQSKKQQSRSDSSVLVHDEEESTGSEGKESPVPTEDSVRKSLEDQDSEALISSEIVWPRQIKKSKSMYDVQALNADDLSLQLLLGENSLFLSSCLSLEENVVLKASEGLGAVIPAPFLDEHQILSDSRCVTVYDPEDISVAPVFDYTLCTFGDEMVFSSLHNSQRSEEKPIPIFSCSHPTVRELTFPNLDYVFLSSDCDEEDISPIRVMSHTFFQDRDFWTVAPCDFHSRKGLTRKIHFPGKGSIYCKRSGAWVFPVEAEKITIKSADPLVTVLTERRISSTQRLLDAVQTTRREGIFSALRQSDMCLVCIAFASWVLKSSDPEAADAWKAALLANVSALSAIQYLRQYVKKKTPS